MHVGLSVYKPIKFRCLICRPKNSTTRFPQLCPDYKVFSTSVTTSWFHGKNEADHDRNLENPVCSDSETRTWHSMKISASFYKTHIEFYGHVFSAKGVSPDPKEVSAIRDAPGTKHHQRPSKVLGMVTYYTAQESSLTWQSCLSHPVS